MKQEFRNTVMIIALLLSTVQPTGIPDARPTAGDQTPRPQPHAAASPCRFPVPRSGESAKVEGLDDVGKRRVGLWALNAALLPTTCCHHYRPL